MSSYWLLMVAILLILFAIMQRKKRKNAAVINHRKNHKKEIFKMKELAQKFIGKDCLVYTIASETTSAKGVIKEVTENGLLIESDGNLQAINLEYVTLIREWPKNAKGKKKTIIE